jgi:hypothetical protein
MTRTPFALSGRRFFKDQSGMLPTLRSKQPLIIFPHSAQFESILFLKTPENEFHLHLAAGRYAPNRRQNNLKVK